MDWIFWRNLLRAGVWLNLLAMVVNYVVYLVTADVVYVLLAAGCAMIALWCHYHLSKGFWRD